MKHEWGRCYCHRIKTQKQLWCHGRDFPAWRPKTLFQPQVCHEPDTGLNVLLPLSFIVKQCALLFDKSEFFCCSQGEEQASLLHSARCGHVNFGKKFHSCPIGAKLGCEICFGWQK